MTKYFLQELYYNIKDFFHLSLFWKTLHVIEQLKREPDTEKRYAKLCKFLEYVKNVSALELCDLPEDDEITSWEALYNALEYFSDRWCLSRVLRVYNFYYKHSLEEYSEEQRTP